mmetsp:Transcript_23771/g.47306  ORF Transcript_23771/g.47306 Transcript_23771/m.47306 type:complete len:121 (+) Transcript_23771:986-1348(+)
MGFLHSQTSDDYGRFVDAYDDADHLVESCVSVTTLSKVEFYAVFGLGVVNLIGGLYLPRLLGAVLADGGGWAGAWATYAVRCYGVMFFAVHLMRMGVCAMRNVGVNRRNDRRKDLAGLTK